MDHTFNTSPNIPFPSLAQLNVLVNFAPLPVRPFAHRLLNILHPQFDDNNEHENRVAGRTGSDSDESSLTMSPLSLRSLSPGLESDDNKGKMTEAKKLTAFGTQRNAATTGESGSANRSCHFSSTRVSQHQNSNIRSRLTLPTASQSSPSSSNIPLPTLTASEYLGDDVKVRLYPHELESVLLGLASAMNNNFFNMYPTYEDLRLGYEAKDPIEESGSYHRLLTEFEKNRKDWLLMEWRARPERETQGRARFKDRETEEYLKKKGKGEIKWKGKGVESVMEAGDLRRNDMFKPTLRAALIPQSREEDSSSGSSRSWYRRREAEQNKKTRYQRDQRDQQDFTREFDPNRTQLRPANTTAPRHYVHRQVRRTAQNQEQEKDHAGNHENTEESLSRPNKARPRHKETLKGKQKAKDAAEDSSDDAAALDRSMAIPRNGGEVTVFSKYLIGIARPRS